MWRRKPTLISIVDERQITFLMTATAGHLERQASLPLDDLRADGPPAAAGPKWVRQATTALMVVPDYWIGNNFYEFQARKRSIITAFIERKLTLDHPTLVEAVNFYDYAMVQDADRRQMLYCIYLQEQVAYDLVQRLASSGITIHRITTPALIWQATLARHVDGFAERGIGLVHLTDGECFLYFYHLGQFLFSRHIQLPETDDDPSEIHNLLNYEINQSFYLYSQKSKRSVDTLYMRAKDPQAIGQLAELLGRKVHQAPSSSHGTALLDVADAFSGCRDFCLSDLKNHVRPAISYKPLHKEITWRPVQWAGILAGIVLLVLLVLETGYLHALHTHIQQRQSVMRASPSAQPPEHVLTELTQALDAITRELGRSSGSGVMMRTLLAMPTAVAMQKITLETLDGPRLTIEASVDADHPDAFKSVLHAFLNRLNQRFDLAHHPLREQDVRITLERQEANERQPLYRIHLSFPLT